MHDTKNDIAAAAKPATHFLPAEGADTAELTRQATLFVTPMVANMANAMPQVVFVLNCHRQIVFHNKHFEEMFPEVAKGTLGKRPGDVLGCTSALDSDLGCGTTPHCRYCGAAKALMQGLEGVENAQECRLRQQAGPQAGGPVDGAEAQVNHLDLRIWVRPMTVEGELFLVYTVDDISEEKRLQALERIFFHDILNTASGMQGLVEMLAVEVPTSLREEMAFLATHFGLLSEEIAAQKDLLAAERGELNVRLGPVGVPGLLRSVVRTYAAHPLAADKRLLVHDCPENAAVLADGVLLARIIGNMVKNALEASEPGDEIAVGCEQRDTSIRLWVHNPAVIEQDVQSQLFGHFYSTKGAGRGLGTWSMRLLGERYLRGRVNFHSSPDAGTTFFIELPATDDLPTPQH